VFNDAAVELTVIMLLLLLCSQGIHMNTLKTKLVECGKPGLSGATVRLQHKEQSDVEEKPFTSSLNIFQAVL
jgi:hypothetical protein